MQKKWPGFFISLEGGEGSGKSTLLHQLSTELTRRGYQVLTTREPGGTPLGESIRGWLLQHQSDISIGNKAELMLFLSARAQHIEEKILPALQTGQVVICDRFNDSTIAYQGAARGLGIDYVQNLCQLVCGEVLPQLTLFLDVSPEIGLARAKKIQKEHAAEGELDRIESQQLHFHHQIQSTLQRLAKESPERIHRLDAHLAQTQVLQAALALLKKFL